MILKGKVCSMSEVKILPFETTVVKGIVNLTTHSKCLSVVFEPVAGYSKQIAIARLYGVLKPGEGKIDVCLRNHSVKQAILPKQTAVGEITSTKIMPALSAPKPTGHGADEKEVMIKRKETESQKRILDKIDLTGLEE